MPIGAHVSAAGGADKAPARAHNEGLETFQFFSRSPRGGKAPTLTPEIIKNFNAECKKYGIKNTYIHAPYYIGFASLNNRIRYGSISVIREELERASSLGVRAVMTHLGSGTGMTRTEAVKRTIEGINKALNGYTGSATFLVEDAAGAGQIIGADFKEVGQILRGIKHKNVGFCLDTQHSFAYGYDWRTPATAEKALKELDKEIGLKRLIVIQANDSKVEFNGKRDRHEHINRGHIGEAAFDWIMHHPKLKHLDLILETEDEGRPADIKILYKLRDKK